MTDTKNDERSGETDMGNQLPQRQQENIPATEKTSDSVVQHLAAQAIKGEREALVALCQSIARNVMFRVMRFVRNQADAEDVAQEVLIRVCENIQGLKDPKAFYGWLNCIILNETRRYIGKNANHTAVVSIVDYQDSYVEEADGDFLPEDYAIREDERREVMEIVDKLPERQREVIIQHYYQNLSVVEIARAMEISHPSVSLYLKLARGKIKNEIEKRSKNSSAMYSISLMPIGNLLNQILQAEAIRTPMISSERIRQGAIKSLNHIGNADGAVTSTSAVSTGLISSGFIADILITLVITFLATGGLLAGGVFREPQNTAAIEQPAVIDVVGEIVFSGSDALVEHLNPKQASVWADNELGALASQNWWVSALGSEDVLYSGEGDSVDEALVHMYSSGEEGEYELSFRMKDETGKTYTLTRQFTIRTEVG